MQKILSKDEQIDERLNFLEGIILTHYTGKNRFNVINIETGLGKSKGTDDAIIKALNNKKSKHKFLVVKKFNDEAFKSADYTKNNFKKYSTIAIDAESWRKWKFKIKELQRYRVIYISHQRYIDLCLNKEVRDKIMEDRGTVIIDEKIHFPIYKFDDNLYNTVSSSIPHSMRSDLLKVCDPLQKYIADQKKPNRETQATNQNKIISCTFRPPENLQKFIDEMEASKSEFKNRNIINIFIHGLKLWYSQKCIYNMNTIVAVNPQHKHWGADNNIILDASADIDGVYRVGDKYNIINQSRVVDHSNSQFYQINFNSSMSNIEKYRKPYLTELTEKILLHKKENDKCLIVTSKEHAEKILLHLEVKTSEKIHIADKNIALTDESIAINWFGNLIGKNDYQDFNQVWIINTPNLPVSNYLMHYLHYSNKEIGRKNKGLRKGKFINKDFYDIQTGYLATEIYQSINRIQRKPSPEGQYFIVNSSREIIDMVLSQMKGAKLTEVIELKLTKKIKKEKHKNTKPTKTDVFIEWVFKQETGVYRKSDITEQLNIKNLSRIKNNVRVKELFDDGTLSEPNNRVLKISHQN